MVHNPFFALTTRRTMVLAVALALGGCSQNHPSPAGTQPVAATVAVLDAQYDSGILTVQLRNTGPRPIQVDRQLVFLLSVTAYDADGQLIEPTSVRGLANPDVDEFPVRMVWLQSGKSLQRKIDLHKGYKVFSGAMGLGMDGRDMYQAGESIKALPPAASPGTIIVDYAEPLFFDTLFSFYTRMEAPEFRGPLKKTITIVVPGRKVLPPKEEP
jgi:hypothetical protein